jgi:PTH1 family peptidyl-tRNA hydrolase
VKLAVGLGNPGRRYAATRHNVGFRITSRFARDRDIDLGSERFGGYFGCGRVAGRSGADIPVGILEPHTFMNNSGEAVAAALRELPVDDPATDLLVVYDDVDLPFGRLRVRPSGGAGGHRGLASVIEQLGSGDFPRLRFGIDRPPAGSDTVAYVLQPFSAAEEEALSGRIAAAVEAIACVLVEGVVEAMNRYNRKAE